MRYNYILNKLITALRIIIISVGVSSIAVAATGPYIYLGAGTIYLANGKIGNTNINRHPVNFNVSFYTISYNQTKAFDYITRAAFGYMFYQNAAQIHELGLEIGFNYLGPLKTRVVGYLGVPTLVLTIPVTTAEKTTTWSTDIQGVYLYKLGESIASLLLKLGVAYQLKTSVFTNSVPDLPGELPEEETLRSRSIAVAGGIGLQMMLSKYTSFRLEVDGLKGGANATSVQALFGVVFTFP